MTILAFNWKTEPKISKEAPFSLVSFMMAFLEKPTILTAFLKENF